MSNMMTTPQPLSCPMVQGQTSTDPQILASNALVVGMANSKAALPSHVPNVHFGNPHAANEKERKAEKNRKDMKRSPTLSELKAKTIKAFGAIAVQVSSHPN
jgi:hypothetical protein